MSAYEPAFESGKEPTLALGEIKTSSLSSLALTVGSAILEGLALPAEASLWFSFSTYIGYVLGQTAGTMHTRVVARFSTSRSRPTTWALSQRVCEASGGAIRSSELNATTGWSSTLSVKHGIPGVADAAGYVYTPVCLDVFVSTGTLKRILEQSPDDPSGLEIRGVVARQLPAAAEKLWNLESERPRLLLDAAKSATVELGEGDDSEWATRLFHRSYPKAWSSLLAPELRELASSLESPVAVMDAGDDGESEDGEEKGETEEKEEDEEIDGFITLFRLPPAENTRCGAGSGALSKSHGSLPAPVEPSPPSLPSGVSASASDDVLVRLMRSMVEAVRGEPGNAGYTEGQKTVRAFRQSLPPNLQTLLDAVQIRSSGPRTAGSMASTAALRAMEDPARKVGEPEHAASGAVARTPGECVSYVSNTVCERAGGIGLHGILLADSAAEGYLAAEFLTQFAEKTLQQVGREAELNTQKLGEPISVVSSAGSMGSRRTEVTKGLLAYESIAGLLPLFVPPRFRLGERDYADEAELEAAERQSGSQMVVWGGPRLHDYRHSVRNVAADRPRAARFLLDVKLAHRCSAIQHAVHGYLTLLAALKTPEGILRLLRGGLRKAAAHLDDAVLNCTPLGASAPARQRVGRYLLHALTILDEVASAFFAQFDSPGPPQSFDRLLRDRDDLEDKPIFKRFPTMGSYAQHNGPYKGKESAE